ncbi:sialate O-acetylesterase [Aurantiacibacter sp. D1-12]|uniref:sialate O-acetylesterase n=1 Tax=Aurantiacibacter sp. D1-12 TaxID=2993658 RepID=UPI00237D07C1|nr:sialate O-acetylesterase [Aurantiacibacter sp. D1-12]MDE1466545.1 hypothetical protein [Aurantiacibacter sp. D1-12]
MPHPVYVVAGQSNAGSLAVTASYAAASQASPDYTLFHVLEGGVSLSPNLEKPDWYPFDDGDPNSGELYRELVAQLTTVLAETGGYFAGFIWVQGEADTGSSARADAYQENLEALIAGLRSEFGDTFQTVIVPLSSYPTVIPDRPNWYDVRDAHFAVAAGDDNVAILDADLYVSRIEDPQDAYRDHIHYTSEFADILFREAVRMLGASELMGVSAPQWAVSGLVPLIGDEGSDSLHGTVGRDDLRGEDGADYLYGYAGPDRLIGGAGNDLLDGGSAQDRLYGGLGDDTYRVNTARDQIFEFAGEGIDTVESSGNFALPDHVENLLAIEGSAGLRLTGNTLGNSISGASGNDFLNGLDGDDYLRGNDGNDRLLGGAGNDVLVGGRGSNILSGGAGNDRYVVTSAQDQIKELSGAGIDIVITTVDFVLPHFVEVESLVVRSNAGDVDLTGNNSNNSLRGNDRANHFDGRGGDDWLRGEGGNDILSGGRGADRLEGGDGDDLLLDYDFGGAIDQLDGGAGNDTFLLKGNAEVWGGAGEDVFSFRSGFGEVVIHDFEEGTDRFDFSRYDKNIESSDLAITQVGDDVRIEVIGFEGGIIILADTQVAEVTFDHFSF